MQRFSFLLAVLFLLMLPLPAGAETKTITAARSCAMGENDTRNETRLLCHFEARKSVLEQAEAYIGTLPASRHYNLSRTEIKALAAAALKVSTVSQEWQDMKLTLTAVVDIDPEYAGKMIARTSSDSSLQNKFSQQLQKQEELEKALPPLQKKLKLAPFSEADELRRERNAALKEISALDTERLETIDGIIKKSLEAKKRITVKMTMKNVQSLLGDSDAQTYENYQPHQGRTYYVWYYGYTRVYFEGSTVAAVY